ncbi:MAG: hypothetical protein H6Q33_980 [Deltaproteobacteria bacterium]|nr:hypothetical protein [Deltaproteobacteria bacterium]
MKAASRNPRVHRHTSSCAVQASARLRTAGRDHDENRAKSGMTANRQPVAMPARRRSQPERSRSMGLHARGASATVLGAGNGTPSPLWGGEERGASSSGLFEPDVLVPAQFYPSPTSRTAQKRGECQLLIAILEDAVHCYQKYLFAQTRHEHRLFEEAEQWLMRPDATLGENERPVVSFEYICAVLDLDPAFLRCGLRHWRERQLEGAGRSPIGATPPVR